MKRRLLFYLVCCVACAALLQPAKAQVLVLPGDYADPSILKDGNDYYMTHSPFHYQPGFLIWHSRDLLHWEPIARAGNSWKGSAWAPDLQKVGDTYYIYFPAEQTNWVITAKDIRGPWTEPLDLKISGIDPGLVVTPEGKRYLFTNGGQVTPLTDDGLARAGETQTTYQGWQYPSEWQTECMCLESPKMNYRNGYYYMTSAEGGTAGPATSHMAVCARSKNVYGPWENSPYNPIVHTYSASEEWWSKGHGTLVEGPDGQWWIVYHAYRKGAYALGRQTLMEPIEWTQGGWYRPVKDMPLPEMGQLPALSDDFSAETLGWQWTGWKEDITSFAAIKKGTLTLTGKGSTPRDGRLMLITAMDTCYQVEVDVTVGKKDTQAGLILFYNESAYAGLSCDGKTFTIYKDAQHSETIANDIGKQFTVRIANRQGQMSIQVKGSRTDWQTLADNIDVSGFHHNNFNEFIALRPALYVAGDGQALFCHFIYKRNSISH